MDCGPALSKPEIRPAYNTWVNDPAAFIAISRAWAALAPRWEAYRLVLPGDVILLKGHNEQKFARIVLAMQGRDVRCRRIECRLEFQPCDTCALLSR